MMTPANDPLSVVRQSYDSFVARDRATHETLLAPEFTFTSPYDNAIDRQEFYRLCWPNGGHFVAIDLVETCVQGESVFVIYTATLAGGGGFRNAERHVVRNGTIHSIEVYFGWSLPHPVEHGAHSDP